MDDWSDFPWGEAFTVLGVLFGLSLWAARAWLPTFLITRKEGEAAIQAIKENCALATAQAQKDVDGVGRKFDMIHGQFSSLDDRTGALEERMSVLEERHSGEWKLISEQMANTAAMTRDASREIKETAVKIHELALQMERIRARKEPA